MPTNKSQLKAYTEKETAEKLSIIANRESRTISKQLEYLVKSYIRNYEQEHGEIHVGDSMDK